MMRRDARGLAPTMVVAEDEDWISRMEDICIE